MGLNCLLSRSPTFKHIKDGDCCDVRLLYYGHSAEKIRTGLRYYKICGANAEYMEMDEYIECGWMMNINKPAAVSVGRAGDGVDGVFTFGYESTDTPVTNMLIILRDEDAEQQAPPGTPGNIRYEVPAVGSRDIRVGPTN